MSRRFSKPLTRSLLAVITLVMIGMAPQHQAASQTAHQLPVSPSIQVQVQTVQQAVLSVESVGMTVSDMDRALDFYTRVLDFKKISDVEVLGSAYEQLQGVFGVRLRVVQLKLGQELIELTEYLTPRGRPIPLDSRSHDRWFQHSAIVVRDMDRAYQRLRQFKVQHTSTAPQRIPDSNPVAAGIRACYFKDPDGHNLELISFPPGKGDPKWQQPTKQLFLGIDHTAIVVSNTQASLAFYQDLLGLKRVGESMNYGTEQEYLNNVQGARLHISGLRSPSGPGIEFLEYLAPQDGRSRPVDTRPNDLLHWQTTLVVKNVSAIADRLQRHQTTFISPRVVVIPESSLGFRKGILVRDPDGHTMRLVEK